MILENKYKIFDTHAHYNDEAYDKDLNEVLSSCFSSGVDKIVNIGYDINSSKKSIDLAKKYKEIYAAIGIHPNDANGDPFIDVSKIEKILIDKNFNKKIVAIGEIGLDYHYEGYDKKLQKEYFIKQIDLARKYNLPVIIHSRDASLDMYNIIKEKKNMDGKILFHCFAPDEQIAKLIIDRKYMIAIGGNITYKRKQSAIDIIKSIPLSQILVETDAPYLSPEPKRGTRNHSGNIIYIIQKLAEIFQIEEKEMAKIVYENSVNFFNL